MPSAMDYVDSLPTLVTAVFDALVAVGTFADVKRFGGTSIDDLFRRCLTLKCTPTSAGAAVWYAGSGWGNHPVREPKIHVVVVTKRGSEQIANEEAAWTAVEAVVAAIDRHQFGTHAVAYVVKDSAIDLDESLAAYDVVFEIRDY